MLASSFLSTLYVLNYRLFDFFNLKFDHLSYSKICAKYHFFCRGLLYQYKFFKNNLKLTMFVQIILNKMSGQIWSSKSQTIYNLKWMEYLWRIVISGFVKYFSKTDSVSSEKNAAKKLKPYVFLLALAIGSRFAPLLGPAGLNSRFERAFQTLHPVRQAVAGC